MTTGEPHCLGSAPISQSSGLMRFPAIGSILRMGTGTSGKSSKSSATRKRFKMKSQHADNPKEKVLVFDIEDNQTTRMPKSELDAKVASK